MSPSEILSAIQRLSLDEQMELLDQIWTRFPTSLEESPVLDRQKQELDHRKAALIQDPDSAIPWDEANEWLRQRHG